MGQFTSVNHSTKVSDLEYMLRHAVDVYHAANTEPEKTSKSKIVKKLAAKLWSARLKLLKAKRYEAEPVKSEDLGRKDRSTGEFAGTTIKSRVGRY